MCIHIKISDVVHTLHAYKYIQVYIHYVQCFNLTVISNVNFYFIVWVLDVLEWLDKSQRPADVSNRPVIPETSDQPLPKGRIHSIRSNASQQSRRATTEALTEKHNTTMHTKFV